MNESKREVARQAALQAQQQVIGVVPIIGPIIQLVQQLGAAGLKLYVAVLSARETKDAGARSARFVEAVAAMGGEHMARERVETVTLAGLLPPLLGVGAVIGLGLFLSRGR